MTLSVDLLAAYQQAIQLEDDLVASNDDRTSLQIKLDEAYRRIAELEAIITPPPPPIPTGIFTRGGLASTGSPVSANSFNLKWATVQATQGGPFDWSGLDQALDASWSAGKPVRLRPMLGASAPAWARDIGVGPLSFFEVLNGKTDPIPALWDPGYQFYAEAFVRALADHVAHDSRVELVFASAAMAKYAEPLVRGVSVNCAELLRGGYTQDKDEALQRWQLDIMSDFTQPIAMSYNPFSKVVDSKTMDNSAFAAIVIMDYQIGLYGPNTVLQNNELGRLPYRDVELTIYDALNARRDRAVINFQVAARANLGQSEYDAIKAGHDTYGATGVEYAGTLTDAQYLELDAYLKG